MNCQELNVTITGLPQVITSLSPLRLKSTITGCEYFTPDCYWFINGDLVCKGENFNYIFYTHGKFILSLTAICGECVKEIDIDLNVSEGKLPKKEYSSSFSLPPVKGTR